MIRPEQRAVSEILRLFDRHAEAIPNLFASRSWAERFVRTLLWIREGAIVMNSWLRPGVFTAVKEIVYELSNHRV